MNKEELLTKLSHKLSKKVQLGFPAIINAIQGMTVTQKELFLAAINSEDVLSLSTLIIELTSAAKMTKARNKIEGNMVGETIAVSDLLDSE